jgi:sigma-E factor negative regulatory protein RseA
MNTKDITREQISALADSECSDTQFKLAFAALRQGDGKADWDIYHQIGDVLRSDDMAAPLSDSFAARMAARLEAEPTIIAPVLPGEPAKNQPAATRARRWALPGAIAAAVTASLAFVATPQLMVAMKSDASANTGAATTQMVVQNAPVPVTGDNHGGAVIAASVEGGTVLRDPRIEDYLLAHQRLSPSVISNAQFASSATHGSSANK